MVVRAAMSAGGNAKTSVNEICRLEENASIYPPSPMRLLHLVNGKRCEIFLQHSVSHVRVDFGNFVCWQYIVFGGVLEFQPKLPWATPLGVLCPSSQRADHSFHVEANAARLERKHERFSSKVSRSNYSCGPFCKRNDVV